MIHRRPEECADGSRKPSIPLYVVVRRRAKFVEQRKIATAGAGLDPSKQANLPPVAVAFDDAGNVVHSDGATTVLRDDANVPDDSLVDGPTSEPDGSDERDRSDLLDASDDANMAIDGSTPADRGRSTAACSPPRAAWQRRATCLTAHHDFDREAPTSHVERSYLRLPASRRARDRRKAGSRSGGTTRAGSPSVRPALAVRHANARMITIVT